MFLLGYTPPLLAVAKRGRSQAETGHWSCARPLSRGFGGFTLGSGRDGPPAGRAGVEPKRPLTQVVR
jgi:hypothetical protein